MTNATSGPTSRRQFAIYDHDSSSWRMWPDIGLWGSIEYSQTWPASGMTRSGAAYELPMLGHHTGGNGSLLLPTPTTEPETGNGHARNLGKEVRLLPTPTTLDDREKRTTHAGGNPTLQGAICGYNPKDIARLGMGHATSTASDAALSADPLDL